MADGSLMLVDSLPSTSPRHPCYITPNLTEFERKDFSQFGEDGVIERVARDLHIERGTFFEFGIGPSDGVSYDHPLEGNFVALRQRGWQGVFLDGQNYPAHMGVRREFITAMNINQLYRNHAIPENLDFMSIDVDGQDFWIWMALQPRPKVMVIEYNGGLDDKVSCTVAFDLQSRWDGSIYQGASFKAFHKLGLQKGYTLVWANGVNMMFVRDDLISNKSDFIADEIYRPWKPHFPDPLNRPWVEV